jgi:Na+/H+-dicarboxylate symporter
MKSLLSVMVRGLRHRGVQVVLILLLYVAMADLLPLPVHRGLYSISLGIKDVLLWMLPVTVGAFIAHTIASFHHRAPLFVVALFLFEALSNLASVWYAYGSAHLIQGSLPLLDSPPSTQSFSALWQIPFVRPAWWSADKGVMAGLVIGCAGAFIRSDRLQSSIAYGKNVAQWTLTHIFSPLIPVFVVGFVARMYQTHLLHHVVAHYGILVLWLSVFLALYLVSLFVIGSGCSLTRGMTALNNLMPAGGIAFTSGCSLSTMPWTIEGTAKNLRTPSFAQAIIPATTNIQQIGDCITNAFLCFLIYQQFYGHAPDLMTWLQFSVFFVLARFYTAAVLGGAIFIMLPIYETYLSFNSEMIAIILAFNVILDPIVTSCNVVANGALCRMFERVWDRIAQRDVTNGSM